MPVSFAIDSYRMRRQRGTLEFNARRPRGVEQSRTTPFTCITTAQQMVLVVFPFYSSLVFYFTPWLLINFACYTCFPSILYKRQILGG